MYNSLLKTFLCFADCGGLNKASEQLFLTPASVMKQINQLETHLDLQLIQRTNHGVALTECGKAIYQDAVFIIAYSEKALKKARKIEERECHTIHVGTSMLNPCKVFMDIWYCVRDRFPQYKIEIIPFEDDHGGILSVIEKIGKEFDFIVGVCDSVQWLNRCSMYPLGSYKKCVAVPVEHRLANRKKLKITDLYGETLIMVKRGDPPINDFLRNDLEQNHPQSRIEDTEHYYDIQVFNHCEQTGNLLLNLACWEDIHPSLITIPVEWDYAILYGLLYSLTPRKEVLRLIEAIKKKERLKNEWFGELFTFLAFADFPTAENAASGYSTAERGKRKFAA